MYSKLSYRNMRRSYSDYAIYFVTLTLAVCLFYSFNSLASQQILMEMSSIQTEIIDYLNYLISLASTVVSAVFAVLCLFANQFFMKRRKSEFGLYMTLGMGKMGVSRILIVESILVAFCSLISGIALGVIISKLMAGFTSMMFNIALVESRFIFSLDAALKTIKYFGLVFLLVIAFNVVMVSKYTLIELLKSSEKSEREWIKSQSLRKVLSILSLVCLIAGYGLLMSVRIIDGVIGIGISFGLILVGSVLFYFVTIPTILKWCLKTKKLSYEGLGIFNLKQMHGKINSAVITMITIAILLFLTTALLVNGATYKKNMEEELTLIAPFDVTLSIFNSEGIRDIPYEQMAGEIGVDLGRHDYRNVTIYSPGIDVFELLLPYAVGQIASDLKSGMPYGLTAISYSDYKEVMELQGKEALNLSNDETLILTNMNEMQETIKNMVSHVQHYNIGGQALSLSKEKYQLAAIETETVGRMAVCFVVPDEVALALTPQKLLINIQYKVYDEQLDAQYVQRFREMLDKDVLSDPRVYAVGLAKVTAIEEATGYTTNQLYIGIYMGFVFLIASGAVLGLRLLSDATDEQERYKVIKRLGATDKMISRSVLIQVSLYFLAPLIIAIPTTVVTTAFINKQFPSAVAGSSIMPVVITTAILVLLYGGYFVISYKGYKKIVTS